LSAAVTFEEVSKRYRVGGGSRYSSLRADVARVLSGAAAGPRRKGPSFTEIAALDNVSFEVRAGDSFALIGLNGAGKSTALKIISRITYPTSGRVRVRGRVGALIEVGAGIHPELSGRENIWFHGQILGMSQEEVRRQFDAIVDFSELEHMLDAPVKMYSSGMQMRLGFAIASHLNPEVFLVDEALAVGDAGFQAKCVERMTGLVNEGRTLLFVSHNLSAVEAVCRKAVLLRDGKVVADGPAKAVVKTYLNAIDTEHRERLDAQATAPVSRYIDLDTVTCAGGDGTERYAFATGEDIIVRLGVRAKSPIVRPHFSIGITDGRAGNLVLASMLVDGGAPDRLEGRSEISCKLRAVPLLPRVYQLWCSVRGEHAYGDLLDWQPIGSFRITEAPAGEGPLANTHKAADGPVYVAHEWRVEPCS
jgi:ABC-type polysaccharide/polyol phosphate transport system ATPase subunit